MNKQFTSMLVPLLLIFLVLSGCGGSGSGTADHEGISPDVELQPATVTGILQDQSGRTASIWRLLSPVEAHAGPPAFLYLDDSGIPVTVDADGRFQMSNLVDGDHTLYWNTATGETLEFPFRMTASRGLDFGTIRYTPDAIQEFTGFNGYHFGFVDADGDGINDHFTDADGDGICDSGRRFAGYTYHQQFGYQDLDEDGVNDLYRDLDGDGLNDLNQRPVGYGFGFVDDDNDGINDHFRDVQGDGIDDISGLPFSHGFGYSDADNDGINDHFTDANGDGINDLTDRPYVAMPGWVDLDDDGINDFFIDEDGDGINDRFVDNNGDGISDLAAMGYAHGFGWADENGDGINDRFVDANGDGINDLNNEFARGYGFQWRVTDVDGNGIDDTDGTPFRHGFGWIDQDQDGTNDLFVDNNGDLINDLCGMSYGGRYMMLSDNDQLRDNIDWPMGTGHGMGHHH